MPTLISCTHTEDGSVCNDCQNQNLAEALSEPEKEWWRDKMWEEIMPILACFVQLRLNREEVVEGVEGVVKKIIAEASRRAVEKRDQEIREMIQEEMNKSKEATKAAVLRCDDRDSIEEMKSEAKGESIAFHIILSKLNPPKTP